MAQLMEDNSAVDPTYVEDFLLTYRTFLESPTIMVRFLCFRFFSQSSQIFSHERNWRKNYNNQKLSNLQNFNPWTNWQKHQFCQITKCQIKFMFSKKATKSSPSIWHYIVSVKSTVKILSIFVAFLENTNFMRSSFLPKCQPKITRISALAPKEWSNKKK